ncbi:MAG: hypothetical protein P8012_00090 [Desulfobacterales bacterium]
MTYRKFDTGTWVDPWFENLSFKAKLGFVYFWTNEVCNPAGIYEISEKRISFELGYHIDTIYSELDTRILWDKDKNMVWVKNFFRHQCQNSKFAISALNSIRSDSLKLKLFIEYNRPILEHYKIDLSAYHIDTISIPYPTEQNRTEQNRTEKDSMSKLDEFQLSESDRENQIPKCPYQKIIDLYHDILPELPKIKVLSEERKKQLKARWLSGLSSNGFKSWSIEYWEGFFKHIRGSPFLMGQVAPSPGHKQFIADFEWVTKKSSFIKIIEGKYHE